MDGFMKHSNIPRTCFYVVYVLCCSYGFVYSQDISNDTVLATDKYEESLISAILRIVDDKFDSISARLGTLERSVNGLQYFSLRQFRTVNTQLKHLDTIVQSSHVQMGQITIENKAVKNSLGLLKKEIKNMETVQNGMFEAFEQNFVYLNQDLTKKIDRVQQTINSVNNAETTVERSQRVATAGDNPVKCNCSELLGRIEGKLDILQNASLNNVKNIPRVERQRPEDNQTAIHILYSTMTRVNYNLEQSINFYRYTGELVERIVGATETVSEDQTRIREDLRHFLEVQTNYSNSCTNDNNNNNNNVISQTETQNDNNPKNKAISEEVSRQCEASVKTLQDAIQLTKNNTQLLEIVTDLAQLSQISMKKSVLQIQDEVLKLQQEREQSEVRRHNTPVRQEVSAGVTEYEFESLLNTSKSLFHIVEAVASSTGWIPYIFHNLEYVESRVNESLITSRRILQKILSSPPTTGSATPPDHGQINAFDTRSNSNEILSELSLNKNGSLGAKNNSSTTAVLKKLNFMYNTDTKLHRLIPALTRLLGEPEPFITLVGGPKENEGRVEIYKKGRWGTICKPLGHIEAAYICRHLGYLGGISAGSGVYGPGNGIFWHINITCLYSRNCEIAMPLSDPAGCDHSRDAAVICDHMIRLTPGEDELSMRNIGRLDMYHNEQYLPVCAENWIPENTRVACRQMGYEDGELTDARENDYLQDGHVWMMAVACTGSEMRLDECKHSGWSLNGCKSRRPVFLHCH